MKITLIETVAEADNITTFKWKPEKPVAYEAGQFVEMTLAHPNSDGRGDKRWFTLSSAPTEPFLSITTKFFTEKSSSFKKALFALKPGNSAEINQPEGNFVLPTDPNLQLLFIAGGIGITPYHSMVRFLTDKHEKRTIKLLYAAQTEAGLLFSDLFQSYGAEVKPFVGKRLTTDLLMQEIGSPDGKLVYISGPEQMVDSLSDSLVKAGLPADSLKSDYFPGYENDYSI